MSEENKRIEQQLSALVVSDGFRQFVSRLPSGLTRQLSMHELRQLFEAAEIKLPWKRFGKEKPIQNENVLLVMPNSSSVYRVWLKDDSWSDHEQYYGNIKPEWDHLWLYESALLATVPK